MKIPDPEEDGYKNRPSSIDIIFAMADNVSSHTTWYVLLMIGLLYCVVTYVLAFVVPAKEMAMVGPYFLIWLMFGTTMALAMYAILAWEREKRKRTALWFFNLSILLGVLSSVYTAYRLNGLTLLSFSTALFVGFFGGTVVMCAEQAVTLKNIKKMNKQPKD